MGKVEEYEGRTSAMRTNTCWLASEDLEGLPDQKVVIEACYRHENPQFEAGRKVKECYSLKFVGKDKQLVLNSTNRKCLVAMFGSVVREWKGKEITLYITEVQSFGEIKNGIRIRLIRGKHAPKKVEKQATTKPPEPAPEQPAAHKFADAIDTIKRAWYDMTKDELVATDKDELTRTFRAWVGAVAGKNFDVTDPDQWTQAAIDKCLKRLEPKQAETHPDDLPPDASTDDTSWMGEEEQPS